MLMWLQPGQAAAQADPGGVDVEITRWDVDISINPDSTFTVREVQTLAFGAEPVGTGARSVSGLTVDGIINVRVEEEDGTVYTLVRAEDPDGPGEPGTYRLDLVGNSFRILWFFEPISDTSRTFIVQYDVFGPLRLQEEIDVRLVWDAIPPNHLYPVEDATVTVNLPEQTSLNIDDTPPAAYGYDGEPELIVDGQTLQIVGQSIQPGEGLRLELYFALEDGYPLEEAYAAPEDEFEGVNYWLFIIFVVLSISIVVGVFLIIRLKPGAKT